MSKIIELELDLNEVFKIGAIRMGYGENFCTHIARVMLLRKDTNKQFELVLDTSEKRWLAFPTGTDNKEREFLNSRCQKIIDAINKKLSTFVESGNKVREEFYLKRLAKLGDDKARHKQAIVEIDRELSQVLKELDEIRRR